MRTTKPAGTSSQQSAKNRKPAFAANGNDEAQEMFGNEQADEPEGPETYEIFRVNCPECRQPIGLFAEEEALPEHGLCASPWDPFGLTVCQGSGRPAADAVPHEDGDALQEHDVAALLTLPEGLDWRTQPFSHAGGPGAPVPAQASHG